MKTNILNFGPIGSGKTFINRTLLSEYPDKEGRVRKGAGLTVLNHACEPDWDATNGDLTCEMGFHVQETLPANPKFEATLEYIQSIQGLSVDDIHKKGVPHRIMREYSQFMNLYIKAMHFECIRCGRDFGNLEDLTEKDKIAYINDGLTGISEMGMHFTIGPKPCATLPEFGRVQNHIEAWIKKCCSLDCTYILVAHWAREPDQVEGGTNITVNTVGQKLAPKLLLDTFSEIILSERDGNKYTWNTAHRGTDQKARRLEYKSGLSPDFSQIFRKDI